MTYGGLIRNIAAGAAALCLSTAAHAAPAGQNGLAGPALVALVTGAWLAAAVLAVIRSTRWRREAEEHRVRNTRLASLLSQAPQTYLIVNREGQSVASDKLLQWLDRDRPISRVQDLGGEHSLFTPEDLAGLTADISDLAVAGNGFTRRVTLINGRHLLAQGVLAEPELAGSGGIVVWFSDVSEIEGSRLVLDRNLAQVSDALKALSSVVEAAPFPIWHRGEDLRISLVNSAYVQAVEASGAAEVIANELELFDAGRSLSPQDSAAAARNKGEMIERSEPAIIGGNRRTYRVFDVPLAQGVAGFAFDIDELEQARADLIRFARANRETLDRLSAGVVQFSADHSLDFFNQPFARIFGLEPEWLGTRPEFDHVLERMRERRLLPEQRDFPNWRNERRGWFTAVEGIEESWTLPGGTHLRVIAQPRPDGGLLMIFEDRTEQLRLASSRDTMIRVQAATLDNLFEAVAVFAANGRLQLWNQRFGAMWKLPQEELLSYPHVDQLIPVVAGLIANPKRAVMLKSFVRSATADRRQRSARFTMRDGRHMEFAAVPLPDGNALFTILDITDSRRIETALRERNEALQAADKIKSSFVANMSYELRTPLTSIAGFGELILSGLAGDLNGQQVEYVGSILEASKKLQGLIDNILDLTSSEAGSLTLDLEEVDLARLVEEEVSDFMDVARSRQLMLDVAVDDSAGRVEVDVRRLRQALRHLVNNALSYTSAGGQVIVSARGDKYEAVVEVRDNGIGIAAEDQVELFSPFQQALTNVAPTAGLGLPLVRSYVTLHGGTVSLVSKPGEGTVVTITLPRSHAAR